MACIYFLIFFIITSLFSFLNDSCCLDLETEFIEIFYLTDKYFLSKNHYIWISFLNMLTFWTLFHWKKLTAGQSQPLIV